MGNDWIPHPNYRPVTVQNDIALLRIRHTNNCVNQLKNLKNWRIILSSAPVSDASGLVSKLAKNQTSTGKDQLLMQVAGWGKTERGSLSDKLQYVNLPIHSIESCNNKVGYSWPRCESSQQGCWTLPSEQFCAGPTPDQKDSCVGDSGGPMFTVKNGKYYQHGIVSYGPEKCGVSFPGVYTQISNYIDWIEETITGGRRVRKTDLPLVEPVIGNVDEVIIDSEDIKDIVTQIDDGFDDFSNDDYAFKCTENEGVYQKVKLDELKRGDYVLSAFKQCTKIVIMNKHVKLNSEVESQFLKIYAGENVVQLTHDHNGIIEKNGKFVEIPAKDMRLGDKLVQNYVTGIELEQLGGDYTSH